MRPMRCEEVRPRLGAYLAGGGAQAAGAPLPAHVAGCAECGPESAALQRLRDDIRQVAPVYRAPEALRRQLRSTLRREAAAGGAEPRAARGAAAPPPRDS